MLRVSVCINERSEDEKDDHGPLFLGGGAARVG